MPPTMGKWDIWGVWAFGFVGCIESVRLIEGGSSKRVDEPIGCPSQSGQFCMKKSDWVENSGCTNWVV